MNYYIYPKRVRIIMIGGVIFTACFLFACSVFLQYMAPNNPSTLNFVKWRYPLIAAYLAFSTVCLYFLGVNGKCTFSYEGITMKRSFRENFIPWEAIEKVTSGTEPSLYLVIGFKPESKDQYITKSNPIYSFENTKEVQEEIKQYFNNITEQ